MTRYFSMLLVFFWFSGFLPVRAETDHTCLNACTHNSANSATCLPKCSYDPSETLQAPHGTSMYSTSQYHCFMQCMRSGIESSICLPQCSTASAASVKPKPAKDYNPNPFHAFTAYGDKVILTPKITGIQPPLDSVCIKLCLKGHLQYGLCEKNCVKQ